MKGLKIFLLLLLLMSFQNIIFCYDRNKAIEYAKEWWDTDSDNNPSNGFDQVNPEYHFYKDKNCANFVSQCAIAGGLEIFNPNYSYS
ncbi:amidase domain-containing protein [bacterium]|nr:hypothetical protein [bacterium]MBU3955950.1 amidase domain-containing protein [bacterium]